MLLALAAALLAGPALAAAAPADLPAILDKGGFKGFAFQSTSMQGPAPTARGFRLSHDMIAAAACS